MGLLILIGIILIFAWGWFMGAAHERGDVQPEEYYNQVKAFKRQGIKQYKRQLKKLRKK